jgi:hypothetical protein
MPDMSALQSLQNLEILDLSRTPLTLDRLAPLLKLERLRELRLGLTPQIDRDGLTALIGTRKILVLGKA